MSNPRYSNMTMSGGGNDKAGLVLPFHLRTWHYAPRRRKQVRQGKEYHAPLFFGIAMPSSFSLGLWTEWLTTPEVFDPNTGKKIGKATPADVVAWMSQMNQFMKTYNSKTLVLRIQAPGPASDNGEWADTTDYTTWLNYWGLDNGGLEKLFSDVTTLQEIHFLPYVNDDPATMWDQASHAYKFILRNLEKLTPSVKNNPTFYMCIEPENFKPAATSKPPPANTWSGYLRNPQEANADAKTIAMVRSNIMLDEKLKLSCVGAPTVGKQINMVQDVDKYIGEWYSDTDIDTVNPSSFYGQDVQVIASSWKNSIKLGDTTMDSYYAMLSIETNYMRALNNNSDGYGAPKHTPGLARLGPQDQGKTQDLAQLITTNFGLKNEVLIYSGAYLEQWGLHEDKATQLLQQTPSALTLQSL